MHRSWTSTHSAGTSTKLSIRSWTTRMRGELSRGLLDTNILVLWQSIEPAALPEEMATSAVTLAELSAGVHLVAGVSGLRPERQDEAGERYRHGADARGRAPCGPAGSELEHGCLLEDKWEKRVLLRHSTPCVTRHAQGFSSAEASRHRTFTWAVRSVTLLGCRMACGLPALDSPRPPAPPSKCPHPMRAPHRPCRPECACGAVPASAPDAELHASDAAPHPPHACDIPVALAPAALDPVALDRYRRRGDRAP